MPITNTKFRADLSYSEPIMTEKIIVKYDGVSFITTRDSFGGYGNRGLQSNHLSQGNPFYITSENDQNVIYTSSSGQHTIEMSEDTSEVETTECFKKAVKSVIGGVMMLNPSDGETPSTEGATWQEAYDALQSGSMVFLNNSGGITPGGITPCSYFDGETITFSKTYVGGDGVYTDTYDWSSDGTVTRTSEKYPPQ